MKSDYLQVTEIIDWQHPEILEQASQLAAEQGSPVAIAKACFEWVRDEIRHSVDYQLNPVTCRASDVLKHKTGFCFAKSHLLAALLRAHSIPAGFCYQRLSVYDNGAPYCLHGLNAVHLPNIGWYRIDPRGNRTGVDAQFDPPHEFLAYYPNLPNEVDWPQVYANPLSIVVNALQACTTWNELLENLPDMSNCDFSNMTS